MLNFNIEEHKFKYIHFIGIGGISMSGIIKLLDHYGYKISGSDRGESGETNGLKSLGVEIFIEQKRENIENPDLIVYTDVVLDDNEELIAARELRIDVVSKGVFLGALMRNHKYSIGISGSHGKSTATSMIAKILIDAKVDPFILLGGKLDEIQGNIHCGNSEYMLTEAYEYKANILNYYPSMATMLNIDEDHSDFYKDLSHTVATFIGYMKNLDENSKAIINIDDKNCEPLLSHTKGEIITFGIENEKADYNVHDITFNENGNPGSIVLSEKFDKDEEFSLSTVGRHSIYDTVAAIIACYGFHVDIDTIRRNTKEYHNLHRRMETIGFHRGCEVKTDYGHYPTEIRNTLKALDEYKKGKFCCVFQPHTCSRTKMLLDDFANAFYDCDRVVVTEIYAAREEFDSSIHSTDLVEKLVKSGINAKYYKIFEEARDYIRSKVCDNDLVLTTGCGNPDVLARMIVE